MSILSGFLSVQMALLFSCMEKVWIKCSDELILRFYWQGTIRWSPSCCFPYLDLIISHHIGSPAGHYRKLWGLGIADHNIVLQRNCTAYINASPTARGEFSKFSTNTIMLKSSIEFVFGYSLHAYRLYSESKPNLLLSNNVHMRKYGTECEKSVFLAPR